MIIYYHNADLDGICSAAIFSRKFPKARLVGINYGEEIEVFPGEEIIMVDVSLDMEHMNLMAQASEYKFTWIDHHKSAFEDYHRFLADNHIEPFLNYIYSDTLSGCELSWEYCFGDQSMPTIVNLLGRYDTWRDYGTVYWDKEILPFQYGMRLETTSLDTFPGFLLITDERGVIVSIIENGNIVINYQRNQNERVCNSGAFQQFLFGQNCICVNSSLHSSTVFDSIDTSNYGLMICFSYKGQKGWLISLYSDKEDIDCGSIASQLGGGGHKGAAGFYIQDIMSIMTALRV